MMEVKSLVKVVSGLTIAMSLVGVGANVANADFTPAPKLASAEIAHTNPAVKKGERVIVTVKENGKNVTVLDSNANKTSQTVKTGSTFIVKAVKKVNGKSIVKVNKSQWLNTKDIVKD